MTNELKTVITFFENPTLNEIGAEIIDLYRGYQDDVALIKQKMGSAIERRFKVGKFLSENMEAILEECGSQRMFGEKLGYSEATISNDKRAFETLRDQGVTEVDQLVPFLRGKDVPATTYSWERMTKLLNEPQTENQRDQRPRDEKRLEDLSEELRQIRDRNQSGNNNHVAQLADELIEEYQDTKVHLDKMMPETYQWDSPKYRQWARSLGWDFIMDEPCEVTEFHHTDVLGGSGGEGKKLPDVYGLPVSPKLHRQIEEGSYRPTPMQIASGLIKLHSLFILNNFK